jgi:hypothetical protein
LPVTRAPSPQAIRMSSTAVGPANSPISLNI